MTGLAACAIPHTLRASRALQLYCLPSHSFPKSGFMLLGQAFTKAFLQTIPPLALPRFRKPAVKAPVMKLPLDPMSSR